MSWFTESSNTSGNKEHEHQKSNMKNRISSLLGTDISRLNDTKRDSPDGQSLFCLSGDFCEHCMNGTSSLHTTDELQAIGLVCEGTLLDIWTQNTNEARVRAIDNMPKNRKNASVLVQSLHDDYWEVRAAAAQALGELREQAFGPPLLKALQEESDFTVRESLVRALGKCREEQSIQALIQILQDQDQSWLVREAAAWSLGEFGKTAPIWPLVQALCDDPSEIVRAAAARALGKIEHPSAKHFLAEVARADDDKEVREAAYRALQQFEKAAVWQKLLRAIIDVPIQWFFSVTQKEKPPRQNIGRAYWQMAREGSLSALTRFIHDKSGFVSHVELVYYDQQPTLLLSCCYQQQAGQTLQEEVISQIAKIIPVEPIGSVVANHRELLQEVEKRTREIQSKRQWYETTLVIMELHPSGEGPTRAVLCGIGCDAVRSNDPPLLDQLQEQWKSYCREPQEVSRLQIGYQSCGTWSS
jgi:hypothetical protein